MPKEREVAFWFAPADGSKPVVFTHALVTVEEDGTLTVTQIPETTGGSGATTSPGG